MDTSKHYIPTLDGWRAIAILLVIFHHDSLHRFGPVSTAWLHDHGMVGVDVFFAISGLLICTLLLNEEQKAQELTSERFSYNSIIQKSLAVSGESPVA
jgi:peptidoglycan/LPS O-acetylase OafA/YrhL